MKPSRMQRAVLQHLADTDGRVEYHFNSGSVDLNPRSDSTWLRRRFTWNTVTALLKRGWILMETRASEAPHATYAITEAGREALKVR